MSMVSRPLWLEGMFISPQHFQQQDRWIERLLEERASGLATGPWGLRRLAVDENALGLGRFVPTALRAVLPDGAVVNAPDDAALPPPRAIAPEDQGKTVHLALPLRPRDGVELSDETHPRRLRGENADVRDATAADRPSVQIRVGQPNLSLMLSGEAMDDFAVLPLARIRAVEPGGAVVLDEAFIPPCLEAGASPRLMAFLAEVERLMTARADVLSREGGPVRGQTDAAGLMEQVLLGAVNRYELLFQHLSRTPVVHPVEVYRAMTGAIGELCAHLTTGRRPPALPDYVHARPEEVFPPLLSAIQGMLATVTETRAVKITLEPRNYGIWIGAITERSIFSGHRFVLVARADVPADMLQRQLPVQIKIGPVEQIRDLVNLQLPGVGIRALPVVPRELPVIADAIYYELDQSSDHWEGLRKSAAFAFHVSGNYPNLYLEFWAIRQAG